MRQELRDSRAVRGRTQDKLQGILVVKSVKSVNFVVGYVTNSYLCNDYGGGDAVIKIASGLPPLS